MLYTRKSLVFVLLVLTLVVAVPMVSAAETPSVMVNDQPILNGTVMIETVVSEGPGWIVIHTQADGKPGPIVGYAPVNDGTNSNVIVDIDPTAATATLYAMLHTDAGQAGVYEFPGDDGPVKVNDQVVTPPFNVTNGVGVADQAIVNNTVTVARVFSEGPGWIVIHTQADGKPGPIIGYAQVNPGLNTDVAVEVDGVAATDTLYAMLHTDAGQAGVYEFPGDDVPVKAGDIVITPAFAATSAPATLPQTGGQIFPWSLLLAVTGLAVVIGGGMLVVARRVGHSKLFQ